MENKFRLSLGENCVLTFFRGAKDDNNMPRDPKLHAQRANPARRRN
jgi:hypothetical protein